MKKLITIAAAILVGLGAAAYAQSPGYGPGWRGGGWGYGMGPGWGQGMGPGMMGPGYGWAQGAGPGACPGYGNPEYAPPESVSADQAKQIATQYVEKYMSGFTVERVLPSTGMPRTMYGVELKGPKGETRYLRINPWGGVVPFGGGPWTVGQ